MKRENDEILGSRFGAFCACGNDVGELDGQPVQDLRIGITHDDLRQSDTSSTETAKQDASNSSRTDEAY
jgi:hypothetical protein